MSSTRDRILGRVAATEFVGRGLELDRIIRHAVSGSIGGMAVLASPGAGASELLRQAYDRLFVAGGEVIPFYFEVRSSDPSPRAAAYRFVSELLAQTVAFRRRDPSILDSAPDLDEVAELSVPADGDWIDRMIDAANGDIDGYERSYVRTLLSAPLRAGARNAKIFVMIDGVENAALMPGGQVFFDEIIAIYQRSDQSFLFAGARRFLFGAVSADTLDLGPLGVEDAGRLVEMLSSRMGVAVNEQTRDLLAVQLAGDPSSIKAMFIAAAEKGTALDSFRNVEALYTDEIFGGRIARSFDNKLAMAIPEAASANVLNLLSETGDATDSRTSRSFWKMHAGLPASELSAMLERLNHCEVVNVNSGSVSIAASRLVLMDYLAARRRLEIDGEARALVVGEAMTEYLKRAPQLLARYYRRNSALGLRALLDTFDGQEIAASAINYAGFKADLKGLSDDEIQDRFAAATEIMALPRIVFTAHTAAFYSRIGELIDDERSTIALGFEQEGFRDEVVWIAAELESKLEASAELTSFWLDRLEIAAINCGFANYKMWLIAPEGFADDAVAVLRDRGAYGSSRKQVELLARRITGGPLRPPATNADEYEIIIPMGEDTEMIAAHAFEEIAKRHNFPAKAVNQIKTALVEACINATEHSLSPDRRIYQKFSIDENKLTITVSNRGIRLLDKAAHEVAPDEGRRGWGLRLMKGLMDEVKIEQSDDGTRITMVKFLVPKAAAAR